MKALKYVFYAGLLLLTGFYLLRFVDMTPWELLDLRAGLLLLAGLLPSLVSDSPVRLAQALMQGLGWRKRPAELNESRRILTGLSQNLLLLQLLNLLLDGVQILGTGKTPAAICNLLAVSLLGLAQVLILQLLVLAPLQIALRRQSLIQPESPEL